MACQFTSEQDLSEFQSQSSQQFDDSPDKKLSSRSQSYIPYKEPLLNSRMSEASQQDYDPSNKVKLPRGGCVINTKIGPIQFSMVPETVKDHLILGLEVPTIYIMPKHRFDKRFCLSVAEFEFPAYFNFFVKKRKIILICDEEGEKAVRDIFQETLLGPQDLSKYHEDFVSNYKGMPDILQELTNFAKNPFNPVEPLTVDTLVSFLHYDQQGVAQLDDGVLVKKQGEKVAIYENDVLLARVKDKTDIMIDSSHTDDYVKYGLTTNPELEKQESNQLIEKYVEQLFNPPVFGITVLGCSHGFDPKGSTSGYILWINRRGVMIDPPPYSTLLLKKMGIPSSFVKWIIVSHNHADHDAGTFQKLLESEKVELLTTTTIMESFVRKYAAMTGFQPDYIKTLFDFRPATIGHPIRINGAEFMFHYSLHSIPCIGFTVKMFEKSLYFTGDHYYDPEGLQKMFEKGVLTKDRYDSIMNEDKWNNTIILHEAGVPPIHTPVKVLAKLPEDVKQRIRLVHVAAKDIPADSGLKAADPGIENTIVFYQDIQEERIKIIQILNLIQNIHLFQRASIRHIRDIFEVVYEKSYKEGESICKEGDIGDEFFIIKRGSIKIHSQKEGNIFVRYLYEGNYFGEACFFDSFLRTANATAMSDTTLLVLQKDDFLFIFGTKESSSKQSHEKSVMDQLFGLQETRNKSQSLISKNKFFSQLSSTQKQAFELSMTPVRNFHSGAIIWQSGQLCEFAIMVAKGKIQISISQKLEMIRQKDSPIKIQQKGPVPAKNVKKRGSVPVVSLQAFSQFKKDNDDFKVHQDQSQQLIFGEGVFVCEVQAMMQNKRTQTSVFALEDCQIVLIPGDTFKSFLESNPGLQVLFRDSLIVE